MKSSSTPATATQSSIKDTLFNATPYPPSSHRHKEITDAVTYMIAKDMCPVNTVSDPGLNKLINTLDKQYVLPSRHHISRIALPALYDECHGQVAREVSTTLYFTTTTDLWLSRTGIVFNFYFDILFNSFYWYIFLLFICIFLVFQFKLIMSKFIKCLFSNQWIIFNNRDYNIHQNNRDYNFCHNRAALIHS